MKNRPLITVGATLAVAPDFAKQDYRSRGRLRHTSSCRIVLKSFRAVRNPFLTVKIAAGKDSCRRGEFGQGQALPLRIVMGIPV